MSAHPSFLAGPLPSSDYRPPQGRIPPRRVTEAYMERLIDEACRRYRATFDASLTPEQTITALNRYVETRVLITEERDRWLKQNDPDGDARQRVESRGAGSERSSDGSKVANSGAEGNEGGSS